MVFPIEIVPAESNLTKEYETRTNYVAQNRCKHNSFVKEHSKTTRNRDSIGARKSCGKNKE